MAAGGRAGGRAAAEKSYREGRAGRGPSERDAAPRARPGGAAAGGAGGGSGLGRPGHLGRRPEGRAAAAAVAHPRRPEHCPVLLVVSKFMVARLGLVLSPKLPLRCRWAAGSLRGALFVLGALPRDQET